MLLRQALGCAVPVQMRRRYKAAQIHLAGHPCTLGRRCGLHIVADKLKAGVMIACPGVSGANGFAAASS